MSNVLVNDTSLTAIANAIRSKLGVSTTYKPGQMASAIQSIPTGGGSGGLSVSKLQYTFTAYNNRTSGTMSFMRTRYELYTGSGLGIFSSNITVGNSASETQMALFDDGVNDPYVVIHSSFKPTSITYNSVAVPFTAYGSGSQWDLHVTIPTGFDGSYQFVFTP